MAVFLVICNFPFNLISPFKIIFTTIMTVNLIEKYLLFFSRMYPCSFLYVQYSFSMFLFGKLLLHILGETTSFRAASITTGTLSATRSHVKYLSLSIPWYMYCTFQSGRMT